MTSIAEITPSPDTWPTPNPAERVRREREAAEYQRHLRLQRYLEACPDRFRANDRNYTPPNQWVPIPDWAAFDQVQQWRLGEKFGLLLTGATGLGKTRAIWELLRRVMVEETIKEVFSHGTFERAVKVAAFGAVDFGNYAEKLLQVGRGEFADWVDGLRAPDIVFLDDLGQMRLVGSKDEWVKSQLFGLIDARHALNKPTFITTNLSSAQIAEQAGGIAGDPLLRRLLEVCQVVRFKQKGVE